MVRLSSVQEITETGTLASIGTSHKVGFEDTGPVVRWSSVQEITETGTLASVVTPRKMGVEDMVQCGGGCSGPLSERTLKPEPLLQHTVQHRSSQSPGAV